MHYKRADRVAAVIQEEVSKFLLHGLKDPALSFVTITNVDVTDDVRNAKIHYSVYGDEEKKENAARALERATGRIRTEIGKYLQLRFVPAIIFVYDDRSEYADHIEKLLQKIKDEKK